MATMGELKGVVKETLENRGVLGQMKARMRAEVYAALDDPTVERPAISNENLIINELIREYFDFNGYKYSASVLQAESGQPAQPLDREFLAKELNISADKETASVPLLYGLVSHFMHKDSAAQLGTRSLGHTSHTPGVSDGLVSIPGERR